MKIRFTSVNGRIMVDFYLKKEDIGKTIVPEKTNCRITDNILRVPYRDYFDVFDLNQDVFGSWAKADVSEDSIDKFYILEDSEISRASLTEKFLFRWIDRNEKLIRITVNKGRKWCNSFGMAFPEFEDEIGIKGEEPLDDFEMDCFRKVIEKNKGSWFAESLQNVLDYYRKLEKILAADDFHLDYARRAVESYEKTIQTEIDKFRDELEQENKRLGESPFSCGFSFIKTKNRTISEYIDLLKIRDANASGNLRLDFPDTYMSCMNIHGLIKKLQELSTEASVKEIYAEVIFD